MVPPKGPPAPHPMIEALKQLEQQAQQEASTLSDPGRLQETKLKYLGRKGLFASVSARIGEVSAQDKPLAGQEMNRVKRELERIFAEAERALSGPSSSSAAGVDVTMPGTFPPCGSLHPLTQVVREISSIFRGLGYSIADGPEVESEYYNFEALNIPLDHPARDGFDTFYLQDGKLLRSQTSTVQIRVMEKSRPPIKVIAPGRVFRPDATDATHSFVFHQLEGLFIDRGVSFAHLKGTLFTFAQSFFGPGTRIRFRPSFFPFTEPSAEMDIWSDKRGGWLEVLGSGMVHPNVLRKAGIDPEKYTGFAFGVGVERMAMMKYGVEDIRQFYENDVRFLRQFS
ncbi:MAG: Phenylalanine--tRNA ligase alpha subunit [Candidatus Omnitrophica bacterium]|nr:Phenylalanine--tRNA ligase alpha subunit [Candidatus Omnitrophota bacterium]